MTLNFPASPSTGDVHNASNNLSYFFDGVKWITQGSYNTGTINTIKLDSLTSSFNGSLTTFNLTSNSISVKPANAQSVMISLGGVIQEPTTAYSINSETGTITFASAPASSTAFFGIVYSRLPQSTTTVSDGAITNAKVNATAAIDKSKLNISDATTSASGYMSASDKTKLDGIEISATAAQTAITNITGNLLIEPKLGETGIKIIPDGAVELYHDAIKKFETDNLGVRIIGDLAQVNSIFLPDSSSNSIGRLKFGADIDASVYHDGSNLYIENATGNSHIRPKASEEGINLIPDGAVELHHDNVKKVETSADGLNLPDNSKLQLGDSQDLQIYHDGSASIIKDAGTGMLKLLGSTIQLRNNADSKTMGQLLPNAEVSLFHNGSKKFETTSSGITVTGTVTETSDIAFKSDIEPITNTLDKLQQITGYKYKLDNASIDSMGVIAQDVEKVFPELVHGDEGGKTLQYSGLIGVLVEAVKDLSAKVKALESS